MTATVTHINGHDAAHHLEQFRMGKAQCASALTLAGQYLELARMLTQLNALPYDIPSGKAIAETLDTVNRDLNGNPPRSA